MCIVLKSTLSGNTRHILSGHYENHQVEIEEKHKLVPGSELRKKNVVKKKRGYKKRQNLFVKRSCEHLEMLLASCEISFV